MPPGWKLIRSTISWPSVTILAPQEPISALGSRLARAGAVLAVSPAAATAPAARKRLRVTTVMCGTSMAGGGGYQSHAHLGSPELAGGDGGVVDTADGAGADRRGA